MVKAEDVPEYDKIKFRFDPYFVFGRRRRTLLWSDRRALDGAGQKTTELTREQVRRIRRSSIIREEEARKSQSFE